MNEFKPGDHVIMKSVSQMEREFPYKERYAVFVLPDQSHISLSTINRYGSKVFTLEFFNKEESSLYFKELKGCCWSACLFNRYDPDPAFMTKGEKKKNAN